MKRVIAAVPLVAALIFSTGAKAPAHRTRSEPYLSGPVDVRPFPYCHLYYVINGGTRIADWDTDGSIVTTDADWVQVVFTTSGGHYVQTRVMDDNGAEFTIGLEVVASTGGLDC